MRQLGPQKIVGNFVVVDCESTTFLRKSRLRALGRCLPRTPAGLALTSVWFQPIGGCDFSFTFVRNPRMSTDMFVKKTSRKF